MVLWNHLAYLINYYYNREWEPDAITRTPRPRTSLLAKSVINGEWRFTTQRPAGSWSIIRGLGASTQLYPKGVEEERRYAGGDKVR